MRFSIVAMFLISFSAGAASSSEKPDEFAHKHWTASAQPMAEPVEAREPAVEVSRKSFSAPMVSNPGQYPAVAVCHVPSIRSKYLILDSDGVDACTEHGGEIVAGRDEDRHLINVKDSVVLKRAKK